jgi:hypothetical protein
LISELFGMAVVLTVMFGATLSRFLSLHFPSKFHFTSNIGDNLTDDLKICVLYVVLVLGCKASTFDT